MKPLLPAALLLSILAPAAPAVAQDGLTGSWTLGVAQLPEYEGSDQSLTIPSTGFRLEQGARYLELQGTSLRANLLASPSFEAGPVLSYRFGRQDADDAAVAALPEIDDTLEAGVFAALTFPVESGAVRPSAEIRGDVGDVHGGIVGTVSTYFGIEAAGAATSGLPVTDIGGGLKDAGIDLTVSYAVSDRSAVGGFVGYRRLLGDFADSPVVADENQLSVGLAFTRRF